MASFSDTRYLFEAEGNSIIPDAPERASSANAPFSDAVVQYAHSTFGVGECGDLEYSKRSEYSY
jgi:hypothetical protein